MIFRQLATVLTLPIIFLFASSAFADGKVYSDAGKAINGYDPVAYFMEGKPVEGESEFSLDWNGARWLFTNAENRDQFRATPERYAPQYGGYCAWAVSQGYTAPTDPEAWKIVGGKLYLNYSKSVQTRWSRNIDQNITAGDTNWPGIEKDLGG